MQGQGGAVLSRQKGLDHGADLRSRQMAGHAHHTHGTDSQHRQRQGVIAAVDGQALAAEGSQLAHLFGGAAGSFGGGGSGGGGGGGGGSYTSTSVSKSYNLTSRATAQQLMKQALTQELGREPTNAEVNRFLSSLNAKEKADPSISTTTTTSGGRSSSSSTTSTPSKVDPGAEALSAAKTVSPDERHMYQSGNYYSVIAQMVGGI